MLRLEKKREENNTTSATSRGQTPDFRFKFATYWNNMKTVSDEKPQKKPLEKTIIIWVPMEQRQHMKHMKNFKLLYSVGEKSPWIFAIKSQGVKLTRVAQLTKKPKA